MATSATIEVAEVFIFVLVAAGYLPVLRAYARERQYRWLLAGYTALLVGRALTVLEELVAVPGLNVLEHAIGMALAGVLLAIHGYQRYRDTTSSERPAESLVDVTRTEER